MQPLIETNQKFMSYNFTVTRDATTLELLPVILPPSIIHEPLSETEETAEKRKGKGKGRGKGRGKNNCSTQIRKPTIVESQLSFIIICKVKSIF